MKKTKKIGLALGSGGIRGLAHVGVIKTLLKHNVPIDYISGCSIGAWVGAHYALFQDIERLEEMTVHKQKEKLLSTIEPTLKGGIVKGSKIEKLLDEWFEGLSFSDTNIPLSIATTDLVSGKEIILTQGKLSTAVRASMAIPSVFAPVKHEEMLLVDGGISNPVPDETVRQMGADIVISVSLDNFIKNAEFNTKKLSLSRTGTRAFNIMRYQLTKHSTQQTDILLEPYTPAIGATSLSQYFTKKIGSEWVKNGEEETEKHIEQIKDLLAN